MLNKNIKRIMAVLIIMALFSTGSAQMISSAAVDYAKKAKELDEYKYSGKDLGAAYTKSSTTFKVWAPTSEKAAVKIYATGSDEEKGHKLYSTNAMKYDASNGVWTAKVKGDLLNKYYTYEFTDTDGKKIETTDIYAKAAGVNGDRAMVVDLSKTNPDGWDTDRHVLANSQSEAIIWELQIKDFSYNSNSGVSEENRGKYLAFTESGTTLNGDGKIPTCVNYLKQLGVTHVQINPFYDFASIDEADNVTNDTHFNWGYDPKNYNVPEGSFSSNPYDGNVRIKETKQMIKALHDAGIGVIMDVVYNHTYFGTESSFNKTVPNYYYRIKQNGEWSNGSGCGNDTASERAMFRKFMIDSVTYWTQEYHIDGFRFDLMGLHDVTTMNEIRKSLDKLKDGEKILMYGEAWKLDTFADSGTKLATQQNMKSLSDRIAAFNDTTRNALKGNEFEALSKGFLNGVKGTSGVKAGILAATEGTASWSKGPTQTVNYASCHDNRTMYDKLVYATYGAKSDFRARYEDIVAMNKLSAAVIFSSQGIPFMLAGEELARSKDGDENSYNSSPFLNMIDWENIKDYSDVMNYYAGMIEIRKSFAAFSDPTLESLKTIKFIEDAPKQVIAYTIENKAKEGQWSTAAIIFNSDAQKEQSVTLTGENLPAEWATVANSQIAGLKNLGTVKGSTVKLPPTSALILIDKKSFDEAGLKTDKGLVIVHHVDKATNNPIKTQVLTGKVGTDYEAFQDPLLLVDYDFVGSEGNTTGKFTDGNIEIKQLYTKYNGDKGKIIFKYIDEETNEQIDNDLELINRAGQQYFTPYIPSFENYMLNMEALPKNGSGRYTKDTITVTYKYTPVKLEYGDEKSRENIVNVIYMNDNGEILKKLQMKEDVKKEGEYKAEALSFDGYKLYKAPDNIKGNFSETIQNVIFSYEKEVKQEAGPDALLLTGVIILAVALLSAGLVFAVKRKKGAATSQDDDDFAEFND